MDQPDVLPEADHVAAALVARHVCARRINRVICGGLISLARVGGHLELGDFLDTVTVNATQNGDLLVEVIVAVGVCTLCFPRRVFKNLDHIKLILGSDELIIRFGSAYWGIKKDMCLSVWSTSVV